MQTEALNLFDLVKRVAVELSSASSIQDRTDRVVGALREALGVEAAVVYRRQKTTGNVPLVYSFGLPPNLQERMTLTEIDPDMVHRLEAFVGITTVARRIRQADLTGTAYDTLAGLKWSASFPLNSGEETVGVGILAWTKRRELTPAELGLCEVAGALIGVALRQDALIEREAEAAVLEERARLARDIHDLVTQSLTATVINVEIADRSLAVDEARAREALRAAKSLARESLSDLRRSIWNLRAGGLHGRKLIEAIGEITRWIEPAGTTCRVEVHGHVEAIPADIAATALSIIRESASNILRHAHANTAEVALVALEDSLVVTVTDDGIGFDTVSSETSFGVIGMAERVESLGGKLRVTSYPNQGTQVEAVLPYGAHDGPD